MNGTDSGTGRRAVTAAVLWLGFLAIASTLSAAEWPGWRGPDRDGSLPEEWSCSSWPEELEHRWQISVGGGYSSPIVGGERVFQLSREGESEVVRAIDIATGNELWRQSYSAAFKPGMGSGKHGAGPKSTPALADGRLFTLGISGVLSAWDAASGELLWRVDSAERFEKGSLPYGAATSPMVEGDRVIVHLGGKKGGALFALDVSSGDEAWSWSGEGPGYASAVAVEIGGVRQIVTQSLNSIVAVEAGSGRQLWQLPFKSSMAVHNVVTPLPLGDGALVLSGKKRGLWAVRPTLDGETWKAEELWRNDDFSNELSSPVLESGRVFGLAPTKKGQLFAVDASTGKTVWSTGGRDAENAALLTGSGAVLALTSEGELWVLDASADSLTRLAEYQVSEGDSTWAHPAVADDRILIKAGDSLTLWRLDCGD
jgi:outer membrane protein assembly factor BamB